MTTITTTKKTTNLEQFYFRITAVVGLTLLTATVASPAFARSPSTFQYTCRNMSLKSNVLYAICRKRDGREKKARIVLRGIDNQDGLLVDNGRNSPASFQASCYSATVVGDELLGTCAKINRQEAVFSKIKIEGIRNEDGNLKY
ncbi:CVNH domain-containing protein [Nostoc sp. PA-18-2419]|uniref:CVNH domain-containing protein n=1 Tax=Nostoc sp. PA-18-2419 TaxID=2575443 RepID=UPI0011081EA5|nr:CVNH domain-containing protein [Nostoc sp. PA-18-2419]